MNTIIDIMGVVIFVVLAIIFSTFSAGFLIGLMFL